MSDVPRSLQSWVSTIHGCTHILVYIRSWKTSAVSTTVWMVETQLCKLRGTSDTFALYGFCELNLRYDYWYSVLHKISSARALCFILTYYIRSWKTSAVSTTVWMVETQLCKLRGTSDTFALLLLRIKPTIWLLILSFTQNIVRACSMFYPYEGYRSVTPPDAARVNRTIFHNH